ncbi:MAG: hypothetical protein J0H94_21205 [Rhizobiales bacterium]|nr:hypothetical protein [Hyphomicrobiales bacterium]
MAVRDKLDEQLTAASPEFGDYLKKYREGSKPLDDITSSPTVDLLIKGEDARTVADRVLGAKWDGGKQMDEVLASLGDDPAAKAGWKAAVAESLAKRVTGTDMLDGGNYNASFAKLSNMFKQNEQILSKVFTPDEMNTLRQGHKLLAYFRQAAKRAQPGSDTMEKMFGSRGDQFLNSEGGRAFELAAKHVYGNLEGGGVIRRMRLMLNLVPADKASEVINMAAFNPDLMSYLLGKKIRDVSAIPVNWGLRGLVAADIADQKQRNGRGK